ncbi:MAG: proline--tRNA ligase, partial [Lachnospiraceae bacterium]|nr:proline--tRNA ligase [Lachnospiraceae bacterium]
PPRPAVRARLDPSDTITASNGALPEKIEEVLDKMQKDMLERARVHRDTHTYTATTKEEFKQIADEKPGFIKAMWCGCQECEDAIKDEIGVTSRCMPFQQEQLADTCIWCGKPAKHMVYWGKAY